jgi:hypothetical protein
VTFDDIGIAICGAPECRHASCLDQNFRIYFRKEIGSSQHLESTTQGRGQVPQAIEAAGNGATGGSCRKDDAALIRCVIRALASPDQEQAARALLRDHFGAVKQRG